MNISITKNVPRKIARNIKIVLKILEEVGIPFDGLTDLRLQRIAEACMAIGNITNDISKVKSVKDETFLRTRDILTFENENFGENRSSGSYDDVRRKELVLLVESGIAINSSSIDSKATNDSTRGYCLSDEFAELLKYYDTPQWEQSLIDYKAKTARLKRLLDERRDSERVPVTLPSGEKLLLSYGEHNQVQKAIIESFLAIFGKGCEVLYVGDTSDKFLYKNDKKLTELGFFELIHDELPDVIAYNKEKNILFLVEAFHCTGQWDKTRLSKVKNKLSDCKANLIFVTAFENINQFKTMSNKVAWETEVWIADIPDHMIHFNGWKFLEIHK